MGRHSCCQKQKLKKGLWSPEEDEKLVQYITKYGHGCWSSVPKQAGLQRCGKSCRLRWINYLRPDLKRGIFTPDEERLIIDLHKALGNRWSQIATQLPGRTDNEIKNYWNTCIKKKLRQAGIDPSTHKALPPPPPHSATTTSDDNDRSFLHAPAAIRNSPPQQQAQAHQHQPAAAAAAALAGEPTGQQQRPIAAARQPATTRMYPAVLEDILFSKQQQKQEEQRQQQQQQQQQQQHEETKAARDSFLRHFLNPANSEKPLHILRQQQQQQQHSSSSSGGDWLQQGSIPMTTMAGSQYAGLQQQQQQQQHPQHLLSRSPLPIPQLDKFWDSSSSSPSPLPRWNYCHKLDASSSDDSTTFPSSSSSSSSSSCSLASASALLLGGCGSGDRAAAAATGEQQQLQLLVMPPWQAPAAAELSPFASILSSSPELQRLAAVIDHM